MIPVSAYETAGVKSNRKLETKEGLMTSSLRLYLQTLKVQT